MVGYEKPENITFSKMLYAKVYNFTLHRIFIVFGGKNAMPAIDAEVITFHVDRLDKTLPNDVYTERYDNLSTYERM